MINNIKRLFEDLPEEAGKRVVLPHEWAMLAYMLFTCCLMAIYYDELVDVSGMLTLRLLCVLVVILCTLNPFKWNSLRIIQYIRTAVVMFTLTAWYPDIFEFTRLFPNQDHVFAAVEQAVFGCQPSLEFSQHFPQIWVSEPLYMGYYSYFFMSSVLLLWSWLFKPEFSQRIAFVITAAFFVYYVIYIFLPVAGPQYYYLAPGVDAAAGVFPDVGHYFHEIRDMYPEAGQEGFFHTMVNDVHVVGERPIAAFPSSHVGVATVIMLLSVCLRARKVLCLLLPFYLLLCLATVYIHAHYAIDAIAGFVLAFPVYYSLNYIFDKVWKRDV